MLICVCTHPWVITASGEWVGAAAAVLGEFYLFAQMVNHRQRGKPQSAFLPRPSKAESCKNQPYARRMTACVCFAASKTPLFLHQSRFTLKSCSRGREQRAAFLEEQYHPLFKLLYVRSISAPAQLFKTSFLRNYVCNVVGIGAFSCWGINNGSCQQYSSSFKIFFFVENMVIADMEEPPWYWNSKVEKYQIYAKIRNKFKFT